MKVTNEVFTVARSRNAIGAYSFEIQSNTNPNQALSMSEECFGDLVEMLTSFADDCGLTADLSKIIQQYLRKFTPAEAMGEGVELRTTDRIISDLADIADFEPNEIASILLRAGYITDYADDGTHGWLMRKVKMLK